jgi:hypothetical protein
MKVERRTPGPAGVVHGDAINAEEQAEEHGIGLHEASDRCWAACHAVR